MKQRISVRAIVQQDEKILLLRRANGRETILGKYELPGGRLGRGEQPEDTLRRYLHDDASLHMQTVQLFDAVSYIDHDDRDIQYIIIVYKVTLRTNSLKLSANYDTYAWFDNTKRQHMELTDLSQLLLGIVQQDSITEGSIQKQLQYDDEKATNIDAVIYSDGGSRGNPGPSAAGFIILNTSDEVIDQGGEYLGITTNSQAEYHGVLLGLERAKVLGLRRIDFRIDSMMIVNQMNGIYTIKNRELWPVNERIRSLVEEFDGVTFRHVHRDYNRLADGIVNKILDAQE